MSYQAGDRVVQRYSRYGRNAETEIHTVARVTPSGQVVLDDGRRFGPDGWERGGSAGYRYRIDPLLPGMEAEIAREAERRALERRYSTAATYVRFYREWSDDDLATVTAVFERNQKDRTL